MVDTYWCKIVAKRPGCNDCKCFYDSFHELPHYCMKCHKEWNHQGEDWKNGR